MVMLVDDAMIAAMIAEQAAAAAAAATAAGAGAGLTGAAELAASTALPEVMGGTIADAVGSTAAGLMEGGGSIAADAIAPAAMEATPSMMTPATESFIQPATESFVQPATESVVQPATQGAAEATPGAAPEFAGRSAITDPSQYQDSIANRVKDLADGFGDSMSSFGSKAADALTDPKMLAGGALSLGGQLIQQSALNAEQARLDKEHKANMGRISAEGDNLNRAVSKWGADYMSADGMEANRAAAEESLAKALTNITSSASGGNVNPTGAMSSDYMSRVASNKAGLDSRMSDYINKMSKAKAPAFAQLQSQIGALKADQDVMNALSRMNAIGSTDRAATASPSVGTMLVGKGVQALGTSAMK